MFSNVGGGESALLLSFLVLFLIPSFAIATEAGKKGKTSIGYFLLSLFFTPIVGGLTLAAAAPNKDIMDDDAIKNGSARACPDCKENVKLGAMKCKHCGIDLRGVIQSEKTRIHELVGAGKSTSEIAKAIGVANIALDKRMKLHFGVSAAAAVSKAKKGEWK